jgi:signal transduction histidine kinase
MREAGIDDRESNALRAHVRAALTRACLRNAHAVAWLRVGVRAVTLSVFLAAWLGGHEGVGVAPRIGASASAVHLAVGVAILLWLRRRPTIPAIGVGAAADLLIVSASAFLNLARPGADAGYLLGATATVLQALLLLDALTMPRRMLAGYAAATWLVALALTARTGLPLTDQVVLVVILGFFSAAVSIAGARMVELVARASGEAFAADLARRHADELGRAHAALQDAQREAERLSSLVVHDLRNPLASIWVNLEEAQEAIPPAAAAAQEAVAIALSELSRLSNMTGDLLLVSRLERRDWRARSPVRVAELLADVARATRAVVARAGANLAVRIAAGAPAEASLEEALVRRLLDNLVASAARHVGPGDRVELAAEPEGQGLLLAVRNSGPPIDLEIGARVFDKNAGGPHRQRWDHNGLGLYLCRLVAERHGGTIRLAAREGWNVSFEAVLPPEVPEPR